jgi:hypothetical protein
LVADKIQLPTAEVGDLLRPLQALFTIAQFYLDLPP